uniref:Uncharacterized protein n=1 Tax=Quercus lobata TaxID=97700 RepID=A0A7N2MMK0_QUELO
MQEEKECKVSVSLDDTIILHEGGDKKLIEERCAEAPAFTIASNAGFDGALFIGKLLEQDNHNLGFDAAKGVYVDMVEERIRDPLKVVRMALVDAARAALQAISNDQVSVPSLVIAVFTHDLWLDHYECYCQLFEDVYANCRRTTLLLVGFSAGR